MGEILTPDGVLRLRANLLRDGKRLVFTNGIFEILHPGHLRYLSDARKLGDFLLVAVNSDRSARGLKTGGRPVVGEEDRAEMVAGLKPVDAVLIFDEPTPLEVIRALKPDVLVKGGDYTLEDVVGREEVEREGGTVVVIPFREGFSTTEIFKRIRRNMPQLEDGKDGG